MKKYVALHIIIICYALWAYFAKCAAGCEWLGCEFILLYGAALTMLGIYAMGWQKILSALPLGKAYANKAVSVIWYIVIGVLAFGENLSWQVGLGALLIITGILTLSMEHD